jgi:hypothetical protein
MRCTCPRNHGTKLFSAAVVFLACSGAAWAFGGSYDPATRVLTAEYVTLGGALYTNMQVSVSGIVSGPAGAGPNGYAYSYDTASKQLTVPRVMVGDSQYNNVVATVGSLVAPGQVSGADVYDGNFLTIPYVQVGASGTVYGNVVVTINSVLSVDGGMPKNPRDIYNHYPGGNNLIIGAVQFGSHIYTNVTVNVGTIVSVGSVNPPPTLSPGTLHFSCPQDPYCSIAFAQLVNTGIKPLNISSITLNSPTDVIPVFGQSNDCPATVGPGQSCSILLYLTENVGPYQGTLIVTDDGPGSPRVVTLIEP